MDDSFPDAIGLLSGFREHNLTGAGSAILETYRGCSEIKQPRPIVAFPHQKSAFLRILLQIVHPRSTSHRVVRAKIFERDRFEAGPLAFAEHVIQMNQFAARKDALLQEQRLRTV